jgi:hypothetical protein
LIEPVGDHFGSQLSSSRLSIEQPMPVVRYKVQLDVVLKLA